MWRCTQKLNNVDKHGFGWSLKKDNTAKSRRHLPHIQFKLSTWPPRHYHQNLSENCNFTSHLIESLLLIDTSNSTVHNESVNKTVLTKIVIYLVGSRQHLLQGADGGEGLWLLLVLCHAGHHLHWQVGLCFIIFIFILLHRFIIVVNPLTTLQPDRQRRRAK